MKRSSLRKLANKTQNPLTLRIKKQQNIEAIF